MIPREPIDSVGDEPEPEELADLMGNEDKDDDDSDDNDMALDDDDDDGLGGGGDLDAMGHFWNEEEDADQPKETHAVRCTLYDFLLKRQQSRRIYISPHFLASFLSFLRFPSPHIVYPETWDTRPLHTHCSRYLPYSRRADQEGFLVLHNPPCLGCT